MFLRSKDDSIHETMRELVGQSHEYDAFLHHSPDLSSLAEYCLRTQPRDQTCCRDMSVQVYLFVFIFPTVFREIEAATRLSKCQEPAGIHLIAWAFFPRRLEWDEDQLPTFLTVDCGDKAVSGYLRTRRKQLLQEAEGYLELLMAFADQWSPTPENRDRLAERALQSLVDSDSNDSHALYLRGQIYRIMERYDDAIPPLCEAAPEHPAAADVYLALGWCYKRTGRLDLAIQSLEEALEMDRDLGIVHYNLACYWSLANNPNLTIAYLAQAFDLDSNYRDMVADEPDFDAVRSNPEFMALTSVIV